MRLRPSGCPSILECRAARTTDASGRTDQDGGAELVDLTAPSDRFNDLRRFTGGKQIIRDIGKVMRRVVSIGEGALT